MDTVLQEKMKAYFSARFIDYNYDVTGENGCPTCGFGADEAMSLEKIRDEIDRFAKMHNEGEL